VASPTFFRPHSRQHIPQEVQPIRLYSDFRIIQCIMLSPVHDTSTVYQADNKKYSSSTIILTLVANFSLSLPSILISIMSLPQATAGHDREVQPIHPYSDFSLRYSPNGYTLFSSTAILLHCDPLAMSSPPSRTVLSHWVYSSLKLTDCA